MLSKEFWLDLPDNTSSLAQAHTVLLLAHGAGAHADSDWMNTVTEYLTANNVAVVRFEFPYMQQRRQTGRKRPPDKQALLLSAWREAITQVRRQFEGCLWIGGKSMGGRMATMIVDEMPVTGVVCLGYPFHPVGKPHNPRLANLVALDKFCLILQGSRDPMGTREEVALYDLGDSVQVIWLEDGDHDFKPRKRSGFQQIEHLQQAARAIGQFIQ